MSTLTFDIETIPCDTARERLTAGVKPPGTITKPETLAKWEEESRPDAEDKAFREGALQGLFGNIISIAWAIDDEPVQSISSNDKCDELQLLTLFFASVKHYQPMLIGHAIATFDCPFVWQRSKILGVKTLPTWWPTPITPPWQSNIFDTKLAWSGHTDRSRSASLADLCWRFGIPCKSDGLDGSKVYDAYLAGDIDLIERYNREDVEAVREVYRRLTT